MEAQIAAGKQIQWGHRRWHSLRIGHCKLNGQAHIRHAKLCHDRAIAEFYQRMHHALAMNHDLDLFDRKPVQAHRLYDLQSLVHQGSAVDGNFGAHLPVRMPQGIRLCHLCHLFAAHAKKRAAGAGQNQVFDLLPIAISHQALEDRRMLRVHGNNFRAVTLRLFHHKLARADHGFLIRQANAFAAANCLQCWLQAECADHGRDDRVRLVHRGARHQALFSVYNMDRGVI